MLEFKGCQLEVKLIGQTPILHFQSKEQGATLRASEVKPKLDKFLMQKTSFSDSEDAFIRGTRALNYKMKIVGSPKDMQLNDEEIPMYYAKKCQLVKTSPILTITTFSKDIQTAIENHLEEFFICHNFGAVQGKGYGSFIVGGQKLSEVKIIKSLMSSYQLKCVYCIDISSNDDAFEVIQNFYNLTKSGYNVGGKYKRSSLFLYMHSKGIDNEKAELKQKKIAPAIGRSSLEHHTYNKNPKYVRALLGMASALRFLEDNRFPNNRKRFQVIQISSNGQFRFQRFPSPLLFKVINKKVYIIPREIDKRLFNHVFTFKNTKTKKNIRLKTPENFELVEFLDYAMVEYNNNKQSLFNYNDKYAIKKVSVKRNES